MFRLHWAADVNRNESVFNYCSATAIVQCDANMRYPIQNNSTLIDVIP